MNQAIQNLTDAITKLNTTVAGALPLLTNPTVVTQIQAAADAVNTASQTLSNAINPASQCLSMINKSYSDSEAEMYARCKGRWSLEADESFDRKLRLMDKEQKRRNEYMKSRKSNCK